MSNVKRIHKVVVKRMYDSDPDTSWLGEYSNRPTSKYSIDREHALDCEVQTYNQSTDECTCSGGDRQRNEYRYFNPSFNYVDKNDKLQDGITHDEIIKYVRQDYERMESLHANNWCFLGISAEADVTLTGDVMQDVTSGGLWGIESDSETSYLKEVEQEQLAELRTQLHEMGFSNRAISAAFKTIEHSGDAY